MDQKKIKNLTYIAAFCFVIMALINLYNIFSYPIYGGWFPLIGNMLIAIALVASIWMLSVVGFSLHTILSIISLISLGFSFLGILDLAVYFLLVLASILRKSAKSLGIIAGVIEIIYLFIIIVLYSGAGSALIPSLVYNFFLVIAAVCFGMAYEGTTKYT